MANLDRRATLFPRSKPAAHRNLTKRAFTDNASRDKSAKLRRLVPVRGLFKKAVEDPWKRYKTVFEFDQAGLVMLAHLNNHSFEEFVIKSHTVDSETCLSAIKDCSHKNVVRLQEALYDNGNIFFIYEVMDVSLAHVFATPLGRLKPYEVAAFCTAIIHGLDYLHNSLKLVHGDVSADNVLLTTDGAIKIGKLIHKISSSII
jgi:serine/threonine protein kinase